MSIHPIATILPPLGSLPMRLADVVGGDVVPVVVLGIVAIAGLCCSGGRLRGTTLVAPRNWAILAVAAVVGVEVTTFLIPSLGDTEGLSPVRYAAYVATCCPIVALLGAKRPQDRGWQMIVLSLWGVMLVPVFSALFFSSGELAVELIWSWFLAILVVIGISNSLPTKYWPAGLLVAVAQLIMLADVLPGLGGLAQSYPWRELTAGGQRSWMALGLICLAMAVVHVVTARSRRVAPDGGERTISRLQAMNRLWFDFRDAFGTIWGLRIAERINANAIRYEWGIILRWGGFETIIERTSTTDAAFAELPEDELPDDVADALESTTRILLGRFVSTEWIEQRLGTAAATDSFDSPKQETDIPVA